MDELKAFYATLGAICYLSTVLAVLALFRAYTEALGFGAIVIGLIGALKLPQRHSVTVDNPPDKPVPVEGS